MREQTENTDDSPRWMPPEGFHSEEGRKEMMDSRESAPEGMDRRRLLGGLMKGSLALSALALTRCSHRPEPTGQAHRWTMVVDLKKCVGCKACMVACKAENHTPPGVSYNVVMEMEREAQGHPFLFRPCMQCEKPSCSQVCPTGATFERADGIVAIDYTKCIGCRYCIAACPYGARSFDYGEWYYAEDKSRYYRFDAEGNSDGEATYAALPSPEYGREIRRREHASPIGNVRKCTFCMHRIYQRDASGKLIGLKPACVNACMGNALFFGDLNQSGDAIHRLFELNRGLFRLKEGLGNKPSVYYLS